MGREGSGNGARRVYAERLEARRAAERRAALRDRALTHARLAVFTAGAVAAWLAFGAHRIGGVWPGLAAGVFVALLALHDGVIRARDRARRACAFYEGGLHRCDGTWVGRGRDGGAWRDPQHLYADDLDVFGRGSLFERLCLARTEAGEARLAGWLAGPAPAAELRRRQAAVAELRGRLDLREDLALLGDTARAGLRVEALRAWGEAASRLPGRPWRALALALPALTLASLAGGWAAGAGLVPFEAALLAQALFALVFRGRVRSVARAVDAPARELGLAAALLARAEREPLRAESLRALQHRLAAGGEPASRRIAGLRRRLELLDARRNQLFAPIGALLLWTTNLAFALEAWRARCGGRLGDWIEALAELEALCSLASFAHEEDAAVFPEIAESASGVLFRARGLAHPLLPSARRVPNDVTLDAEHRAWIVSGSNMSGKSTLLRAVGVNAVLALAGGPVCADRLELGTLRIGASIQIHDSLLEGRSRFYAEIERLRDITRAAESGALLFLLDEVLHGTNSQDRARGAELVVRGLLSRGACGLVTTHDLALGRLAETLAGVRNVHFVDHLEDGVLAFDYRLRPGVLERGNALELMRAVGLGVEVAR